MGRRGERLLTLKKDLLSSFSDLSDGDIICIEQDVSKLDDLHKMKASLDNQNFAVDILVNNAGYVVGTDAVDEIDLQCAAG